MTQPGASGLRAWLARAPGPAFNVYAVAAAFSTYFCMYAFRKPFAAASYSAFPEIRPLGAYPAFQAFFSDLPSLDFLGWALTFKVAAVISQILGYATSKYAGIKFCSEAPYRRRALMIVLLIGAAELALLLFAVLPGLWKLLALFLNGLPLGMIWGLVFGFLEGRRTSEVLGAGLSCSYIIASGYVKGLGEWWMGRGVPEDWMPFVTGATFLAPLWVAVFFLGKLPAPSREDEEARTKRVEMDGSMRWSFLRNNLLGIIPLLLLYFFLTAHRDVRDNFASEIWVDLGYGSAPSNFTVSENWITLGVLCGLALLMLVKRHRNAVVAVYGLMTLGVTLIGVTTLLYDTERISGRAFMTVVGLGMYLAYVPFGCVLFDRLQALLGSAGNAIYGIYLTDALGYTGAVMVMLYKDISSPALSFLDFFRGFSYVTSALCAVCFLVSLAAFLRRVRT